MKKDDLAQQIEKLSRRLDRLEKGQSGELRDPSKHKTDAHNGGLGFCSLPNVPERTFDDDVSSNRARLIRVMNKKWVNGTKLRYYFFDEPRLRGDAANVSLVREAFDAWADLGIGIEFEEENNINNAQIRIGFLRGDGAWSYVGRDVVDIPGRNERTMNFGWDLTQDPRGGGLDTPIHEIGHTLGFPHEHQNPFSGIVWDEQAVYEQFAKPPNSWPRETTFHNVLRKLSASDVEGSTWDPNSIMHYSFGPGLIREPAQYRNGLRPTDGLTEKDIDQVRKFYPPTGSDVLTDLKPFRLESLALAPAEQKNFSIVPDHTNNYTIQTFGASDTVMVLFAEAEDGELEFIAGDDDSGTSTNARITANLVRERRYVLRIRMYLNWASGDTFVMMT
jgi:hypothetical protein